ncbi:MAG: ABC-2 type transport system permease protein [Myxococcota bacterium]|jgi:ABC-2 type transport system permease protein
MNRERIRAVAAKEWIEIKRNKMVLLAMCVLPLTMVGLCVVSLLAVMSVPADQILGSALAIPPQLAHLTNAEVLAVIITDQNIFYLILTPMILPVVIGAYSIIGEKETRSLEPLLASPITTVELLAGKAIAAVRPAIIIGFAQFALAVVATVIFSTPAVTAEVIRPLWILGILVAMPLLATMCTLISLIVSSKMTDVRAAQGVAGMVVLPVVGIGITVLVKQLYLELPTMAIACAGLVVLTALVAALAVRTFNRERILTRLG